MSLLCGKLQEILVPVLVTTCYWLFWIRHDRFGTVVGGRNKNIFLTPFTRNSLGTVSLEILCFSFYFPNAKMIPKTKDVSDACLVYVLRVRIIHDSNARNFGPVNVVAERATRGEGGRGESENDCKTVHACSLFCHPKSGATKIMSYFNTQTSLGKPGIRKSVSRVQTWSSFGKTFWLPKDSPTLEGECIVLLALYRPSLHAASRRGLDLGRSKRLWSQPFRSRTDLLATLTSSFVGQ